MVAVGLGNIIATTNSGNTNNFENNLTFLAISDNGANIGDWTSTGAPGRRIILARTWRVSETGSDLTGFILSVQDNTGSAFSSELPPEATGVYLLVDSDSDFSSGATSYDMVLSGSNWIWTGDLNDGQFFTFATQVPAAPGGIYIGLRQWLDASSGTYSNL